MSRSRPPITARSFPEQILERLRDDILTGRHAAGTALRIDALASELGTSHMPVREALHILTMEGLAVRLPRRGVVVSAIDADSIEQAYSTLSALEAEAARAAAERITPEQSAGLRGTVADAGHASDLRRRLASNRSLHERIDAITPNRWRDEFAGKLRNFIFRMRHVHPPGPGRQAAVATEHAALVEAIAARDGKRAARLAAAHSLAARDDLLAQMGAR